ncbi:DUF2092 domain-containing protein [Sulfuricaulis sp.]|jgi:hypothetical protein|uniref:DUF2092 domain-containing protein n=1 Tax=Sulfuricaulis sp. TaxID=2003553 RepID=UPI00355989DF
MKASRFLCVISALLVSMAMVSVAPAQQTASMQPAKIVRQMCDYLKSLQQFSYRAEVTYDAVDAGGQKVQHTFDMETSVRRPDRLRVNAAGDVINKQFFFDGKSITLYDKISKVYATLDVPPNIEAALDKAQKDFNLRVALTDLASPKLYDYLSKNFPNSRDLGIDKVRGVSCHHLVFDRKDVQVQLWIDAGGKPLPQKVVITEKNSPESPQWTALLNDWNVSSKFDDSLFAFVVPTGVQKINFLPAQKAAASGQGTESAKTRR